MKENNCIKAADQIWTLTTNCNFSGRHSAG